ncbi:MAG TPA: hypothetical protein VME46_24525 [Acidimicrobiales bacterium]|nr:hypothetical protein [Acidimicrobiales bacterium]
MPGVEVTGPAVQEAGARELSILYGPAGPARSQAAPQPEYFADLNLDQFVAAVTRGREEYDLAPFFYQHLTDQPAISYRQEVFRDLASPAVLGAVSAFAEQMRDMRARLGQAAKLRLPHQAEIWFVEAVEVYCGAVASLARDLGQADVGSRALEDFRAHLVRYIEQEAFTELVFGAQRVHRALSEVRYSVLIKGGGRVTVSRYEGEPDYSAQVLASFERFKQGAVKDYRARFPDPPDMNHVEANVLAQVVRLYPEVFAGLDEFCRSHRDFVDPTLGRFDREIQFYLGYLQFVAPMRAVGLPFCQPKVSGSKEVLAEETFDVVLARKLVAERSKVVCNDFHLRGAERVLVVSGPNQGGKTTFARTFGQLHHLACIGCPVPGTKAQLHLFDQLYTHFEREEDVANMAGKLEDDLMRARRVLSAATAESVIVLNEIFSSTTLADSLFLGTKVMDRLVELDVLAVLVTFVVELASFGPSTVSMVSTVVPEQPAERTYKVVRQRADGLAYALAIAEKYGVTYKALKRRVSG